LAQYYFGPSERNKMTEVLLRWAVMEPGWACPAMRENLPGILGRFFVLQIKLTF
jgi:hypothetical protein